MMTKCSKIRFKFSVLRINGVLVEIGPPVPEMIFFNGFTIYQHPPFWSRYQENSYKPLPKDTPHKVWL